MGDLHSGRLLRRRRSIVEFDLSLRSMRQSPARPIGYTPLRRRGATAGPDPWLQQTAAPSDGRSDAGADGTCRANAHAFHLRLLGRGILTAGRGS